MPDSDATDIVIATFATAAQAEGAMQDLISSGADPDDVSVLEAGRASQQDGDRALVAVRVGRGHVTQTWAHALLKQTDGHPVSGWAESAPARSLVLGLRDARDPFQPPEAILPAPLFESIVKGEQPEVAETDVSTQVP